MGLQWEREERRTELDLALDRAIVAAITDAESDYDAVDAAFLRSWHITTLDRLNRPELPTIATKTAPEYA